MQNWTRKIKVGLFTGLILIWSGYFFESLSSMTKPANPMQASRSEGLQLLEEACASCHDLQRVFWQQKTEEPISEIRETISVDTTSGEVVSTEIPHIDFGYGFF